MFLKAVIYNTRLQNNEENDVFLSELKVAKTKICFTDYVEIDKKSCSKNLEVQPKTLEKHNKKYFVVP